MRARSGGPSVLPSKPLTGKSFRPSKPDWFGPLLLMASGLAIAGSITGLLLSYHINLPAGPAIVLTLGALYLLSLAIGPLAPLASRWRSGWHFER